MTGVELFSETEMFAYQNADPQVGAEYDMISVTFVSGTTFSNVLPFALVVLYLQMMFFSYELWGWYAPSQGVGDIWPAINLRVNYGEIGGLQSAVVKD